MNESSLLELLAKEAENAVPVRLHPLGLVAGESGRRLIESGSALPLAGGPFAFSICEILTRRGNGVRRQAASIDDLRLSIANAPATVRRRIDERLGLLSAPRGTPGPPRLMGIVNVTPDSFSDGGEHDTTALAIAHGLKLADDGADILDIGGDSSRPGARPTPEAVELERVVPVLEGLNTTLRSRGGRAPALSIDTRHAAVMTAALAAGATVINDITALGGDPRSLAVAAKSGAEIVLMHIRGDPATMNEAPAYDDVVLDVFDELEERVAACVAAGIDRSRLIVDPGLGFAKRRAHNVEILNALSLFHGLGCRVLVGASRKGLTDADRDIAPVERLPGSLAAAFHALSQGVQILRVHDVAASRQVVTLWSAMVES